MNQSTDNKTVTMLDKNSLIKKLHPADILLVSKKGLTPSINRALGGSKWHHVMLYLGKGVVLEVTATKGCHISKLDLNEDSHLDYKALRHKKISGAEKRKIVATAAKLFLGQKFSWLQLAKIFLRRLLELKANKGNASKPGYKCSFNRLICSNIVAITYHMAGCSISDRWAPDYVMPRDYAKLEGFETVLEKKAGDKAR